MITKLCFMQGTPIKVTPDKESGKIEIPVGEEGTTIVITFTPSNPDKNNICPPYRGHSMC